MAQPHPQSQQRPSFSQPSQSFNHGFQQPNGRPQFSPQSPSNPMQFSSTSPQPQFSPTYSAQGPPTKRPRLSPDAPSPFSPSVNTPQAASPVNGQPNGYLSQNAGRSSLMPPPQQPAIKKEARDEDVNVYKSAGINFEEEAAGLTNFANPMNNQNSFQGSFEATGPNGLPNTGSGAPNTPQVELKPEERETRDHQRQDWDESRHSQQELWDPFVYGATLNDRIKTWSHRNNLAEPQSGVLVNTQRNQPPPIVRVNGHEGATRVINQGQSILDTREKADRLNELVKLLSLSAKARMSGLIQAAARLAIERTQHSQGRVPDDWKDIAVVKDPSGEEQQNASSPAASAGRKRKPLPVSLAVYSTDNLPQELTPKPPLRLVHSNSPYEQVLTQRYQHLRSLYHKMSKPRMLAKLKGARGVKLPLLKKMRPMLQLKPMFLRPPPERMVKRRPRRNVRWQKARSLNSSNMHRRTKQLGWLQRVSMGGSQVARRRITHG